MTNKKFEIILFAVEVYNRIDTFETVVVVVWLAKIRTRLLSCRLHIKNRSDLCSVLSNIRTGPTDANAFRGHRLTTQKGIYYGKSNSRLMTNKKFEIILFAVEVHNRIDTFETVVVVVWLAKIRTRLLSCRLHIKNRSDLCSVLSNIRTGPTDANAFRGHRLTTQKGIYYGKSNSRLMTNKKFEIILFAVEVHNRIDTFETVVVVVWLAKIRTRLLSCRLHIKNRSDLCSVLSNIRTGPTDANAFRGHRLTAQKGIYYGKSNWRLLILLLDEIKMR